MSEEDEYTAQIKEALGSDLTNVYFNGFTISVGAVDTILVLKLNNKPILLLNTTHSIAKTLAEKLGTVIASYEEGIGNNVLTTDEIDAKLGK